MKLTTSGVGEGVEDDEDDGSGGGCLPGSEAPNCGGFLELVIVF
jgi:hypothetical protein